MTSGGEKEVDQSENENQKAEESKQEGKSKKNSSGRKIPKPRVLPDGGEDQIERIKTEVEKDKSVNYDNWDKWRRSIEKEISAGNVSEEEALAYLDDIETIAKQDNINNYVSLISQVANNPEHDFHQTANEADRTVYYSNQGRDVIVEPDSMDRIDLKTVDHKTGDIEYIELKYISSKDFDTQDYQGYLSDANDKFRDGNVDVSDGDKVLEFHLSDEVKNVEIWNVNRNSTTKAVREGIKEKLRFDREEGRDAPITDEIRVVVRDEDDPSVNINISEIYADDTGARKISWPMGSTRSSWGSTLKREGPGTAQFQLTENVSQRVLSTPGE